MEDGKGGAYRITGHIALRVRATDSRRRWLCSVEQAPAVREVPELADGLHHPEVVAVRVVRGREPGRVLVPAQEHTGARPRAMAYAVLMALRLLDETRAAVEGE